MPRPRKPVPSYRKHRQSGQAVVSVTSPDGRRKDILLGLYGSAKSKKEYQRIIGELAVGPGKSVIVTARPSGITVAEMVAAFWDHAANYYVNPDGTPGREQEDFSWSLRPLRKYDHTLAAEFGPLALKACRQWFIDSGLCRKTVNQRVGRIVAVFKWATSEQLIPPAILEGLRSVGGLRKGKTTAPDYDPVRPVGDDVFESTLPHLPTPIAAMLRILRTTGMRPGELVIMRPMDLDKSAAGVWTYRPSKHKTANRGRERIIYIGPKAQLILKPYLSDCPDDGFVFSPIREREKLHALKRMMRKTKVQPSQLDRSKASPKKLPGEQYTPGRIANAVSVACRQHQISTWFPYQLRHAHATECRKHYGIEAARVLLGHSSANVTEIYAELDHGKAIEVAKQVG